MKPPLNNLYPLNEISALLAPGQEAYLVGGAVRDLAAGRQAGDIDLAVAGDTGGFARMAADRLGGVSFVMDAERAVYRVVVKGDTPLQVDVSPLAGGVQDDLAARDFTINAMAVPLGPFPPAPLPQGHLTGPKVPKMKRCGAQHEGGGLQADVIDPFGGMSDLRAGLIRVLSRDAFVDDPLRLLRAFRLSCQLGFEIEGETFSLIKGLSHLISDASSERLRDELYFILKEPEPSSAFRRMSEAGLLSGIIKEAGGMAGLPQGEPHVYDLLEHSLKAMEYAEEVIGDAGRYFGDWSGRVMDYFDAPVDGGLQMAGLIKLAAFLHDIGKPAVMKREGGRTRFIGHDEEGAKITGEVAGRLKMSGRAAETLTKAVRHHMRPLHLSQGPYTRHALYRYVRDMGDGLPASLVVALADAFATRERPDALATDVEGLVMDVASYYYGEYGKAVREPLLNGRDLIGLFGLAPGPAFKEILEDVEEKRGEGVLATRDDAVAYVRAKLYR